ncbi:hypothetical protein ACP4OV_024584 [Aristida adscensionis]
MHAKSCPQYLPSFQHQKAQQPSPAMEIALVLPLLLLVLLVSPAVMSSTFAPAPAPGEHAPNMYIVYVSRDDYVDSVAYDVALLATVLGSKAEAKRALVYHYSGLGFAARLTPNRADQLTKKEGIAVFKDETYHVAEDARVPRFFEENV